MYPPTHAAARPDHPALVMAGSGAGRSYAELDDRSARLARRLRAAGLRPDDTVAAVCENRLEWAEIVWATQRSGLCLAPVSPLLPAPVLAGLLADCAPDALITTGRSVGTAADALASAGVEVGVRIALDGGADSFEDYEAALAAAGGGPPDDERLGTRMMITSGTTGRPKAIRQPRVDVHPAEAAPHLGAYTELFGLTADTVYLVATPAYHVAPLRFLVAVQQLGGTVVMLERFEPAATLAAMDRHRVSHVQFVPTMLARMLALPEAQRDAHDLSALRVAITGAAPCPPALKRAVADWWGPVLHELYGTSESYGSCHIGPEEGLRRPGSVGRAVHGRVHILAPDADPDADAAELPAGRVGQVWFSGGADFRYLGDPAKTSAARDGRGRATVGDMGRLDADGYLYLTGRRDDVINCGGVNVHPTPLEDALAEHPDVAEACVIGLPDPDLGERPCAVVVPAPGAAPDAATAARLLEHTRVRAGAAHRARDVRFVTELPRVETGKLDRRALRSSIADPRG